MANSMSSINLSIVTAEVVSLLNILSVFFFLYRHHKTLSKSSKFFLYSTFALSLGLVFDITSYVLDLVDGLTILKYIVNYLTIVLPDLINVIFILYIYSVACISDEKTSKLGVYLIAGLSLIDFIYETYGILSGTTVAINNGVFTLTNKFNVFYVIQAIVLIIGIIFIVVNKKALKLNYVISFAIYYIIPLIAIAVSLLWPQATYIYSSIAIAFIIVYVEIESRKERILISRIKSDSLTKLLNRTAFNERVKELQSSKDILVRNVGIIFLDINGLKKVNDTYGHRAGDELITNFSKLLLTHFRESGVFRMSGDEFVILLNNVSEEDFDSRFRDFKAILNEHKNVASAGSAYGSIDDINDLIDKAEKNMYIEKEGYHKKK